MALKIISTVILGFYTLIALMITIWYGIEKNAKTFNIWMAIVLSFAFSILTIWAV